MVHRSDNGRADASGGKDRARAENRPDRVRLSALKLSLNKGVGGATGERQGACAVIPGSVAMGREQRQGRQRVRSGWRELR